MDEATRKLSTTTDGKPPEPGLETAGAPKPIDPVSGQHGAYWVLSEEERSKGFIRPVRRSYIHTGIAGPKNVRELTLEEKERYSDYGYVKYEEYPKDSQANRATGRFWTQEELTKVGKGCQTETTMGVAIAETYARSPHYYGSTFCVNCKAHLPVEEFQWPDGSVLGS